MNNTFKYAAYIALLAGGAMHAFGIGAGHDQVTLNQQQAQIHQLTGAIDQLVNDLEKLIAAQGKLTLDQAKTLIDGIKVKFTKATTDESTLKSSIGAALIAAQGVETFSTGDLKTFINQALTDATTVKNFSTNDLLVSLNALNGTVTTCETEIDTTSQAVTESHGQVLLQQAEQAQNSYEAIVESLFSNGEISYDTLLGSINSLVSHITTSVRAASTAGMMGAGGINGTVTSSPWTPATESAILLLNMVKRAEEFDGVFDDASNQLNTIKNNL